MEYLSSVRNPRIQFWRSLKERKNRLSSGSFLVEGVKMVQEALASEYPLEAVLIREDFSCSQDFGCPVYILSAHVFDQVCNTRTPQGIAAVLSITEKVPQGPRLIALDALQDPGNVGTIIRTADAAGFDGILIGAGSADVYSPRVLQATMGSVFRMGLLFPDSLPNALQSLRGKGYSIISSQLDGEPFYERSPIPPPYVLIIGNEGNGISEAVRREATHRFRLPMRGGAESLNAAVAAGIMMYDLIR